jgi:hypothetical protein
LNKEGWNQVRPEVEVKKVAIPQGEETYILCRTAGRKQKEKAIRSRFCSRMEKALQSLEKTIATGRLKDRHKMERRLGKIQARHPQVNDLYEVNLRETPEGVCLFWQMKQDRKQWRESRDPASVSSKGAARQGSRDGGLPGLRAPRHVETSAEAPAGHRSPAVDERCRQPSTTVTGESSGLAFKAAER